MVSLLPSEDGLDQDRGVVRGLQPSIVRGLAWGAGLTSIALLIGGIVLLYVDREAVLPADLPRWDLGNVADQVANIGVPVIGMVLAARRPRNPIGWMFLVAGATLGVTTFAGAYAAHALRADPGSLPGGNLAAWLSNWLWPIPICTLPFLFLLFPDGRLRSRRWRPVAWAAAAVLVSLLLGALTLATWAWSRPFTVGPSGVTGSVVPLANAVFLGAFLAFPVVLISSFASLFLRFKGSVGDERLQLKWFATAAAFVAVCFALQSTPIGGAFVLSLASTVSLLFLYWAVAVAVLKYRLYEIDVVIGRTVVFALLAGFITVVYVGVVVGVGTLVGTSRSPFLSAVAAALVAVAFQPVRQRARRIANRVVYGKRATPYEVLSGFTERAAETYSTDDVLPRLVRLLGEGIDASGVRVWLCVGTELRSAAEWPSDDEAPPASIAIVDGELPAFGEGKPAFPVRHGGELLGAISVVTKPGEPLGRDRERLVADVAAQTGLVLRNVRLIEELRESRRRIVAAQDERAKALERNIHDGAQQQLVALSVKQRLAESLIDVDPAKAKAMLAEIQTGTQDAIDDLRDLARGIYPPLLAERGLGAALAAQARKAALPVDVDDGDIGRYAQQTESAVYFCCLEALQNAAKYAEATRATIRLTSEDRTLRFEVQDDGVGFDTGSVRHGTGLQGMADRLDALGGSLVVRSALGEGTTLIGVLPTTP
jgi:signal transduction histidine kinase